MPSRPAPRLAALAAVLLASVAAGQDPSRWPTPPANWWRSLGTGTRATYEMKQGPRAARRVMKVEQVEGSRVTVSFEQTDGTAAPCRMSATLDVADPVDVGDLALPEGARLTKVRTEAIQVGGRELTCDVYEVALEGPLGKVSITAWHCPKLPPVFMGGVVKLASRVAGIEASISLVEYEGELLP